MAILDVPLHIPAVQLRPMLDRELRFRDVVSVKVYSTFMRIEHNRKEPGEIVRDLDSCRERLSLI
jgi:hypothetical protein